MKSSKLATSLIVCSTLLSSATFAYQTSLKGEVPTPYNWTGFYAGLNGGIVNHTMNITDNQATSFNATIQQESNYDFLGGFQLGYRRQIDFAPVSGVYGIEFSGDFANASFSQDYGSPFSFYQLHSENELQNLFLLQLIGGVAADRTLLFLAAGVSRTNISGTTTNLDGAPFFNSFNMNKKQLGMALGGGIEYAFTQAISVRFKMDVIVPETYSTTDNIGDTFEISNSILQTTVGVNYRFA